MAYVQCPFCDSYHVKMISLESYLCDFCGRKFSGVADRRDQLPGFDI